MKIANNFEPRKIASAKSKTLFAIAFVCVAAGLLLSPSFRVFAVKHPGIIGVLVAVTGEVYFDWKEEIGKHARWKKCFMALLVVSLSYELYEASETDKEAADAIKLAGKAIERAAIAEREAADSKLKLEKLRRSLPIEQPVMSAAAFVSFSVSSSFSPSKNGAKTLAFHRRGQPLGTAAMLLGADDIEVQGKVCRVEVKWSGTAARMVIGGKANETAGELLHVLDRLTLIVSGTYSQTNSSVFEISGGSVTLLLNGSCPKTFVIPPQKPLLSCLVSGFESVTNAASPIFGSK
jgi:hypothetical protein